MLATALAGDCCTNQRETVLLTALFPEAANAEEAYARCLRLRATLEEAFPELRLDLLLSTLEMHRMLGRAGEGKLEPKPLRIFRENPQQATVQLRQMKTLKAETQRAEQLVTKRSLQGQLHLHALVVLGWRDLMQLRLVLWQERAGLDLSMVVVGGGSRELREYKAPVNPEGYRKQLYITLYYLFKEYRIEAREKLFQVQLPAALNQKNICAKTQLIWNRSLTGGPQILPELSRLLEALEKGGA